MFHLKFIIGIIMLSVISQAACDCVQPPLVCPNKNVTFWLYTRNNQDNPHQIYANDSKSIKSAPWVAGAAIKILIHGYTGTKDNSPNSEIRPAYMKHHNYNIISIDYHPLAILPCYLQAVANAELVGKCTAQLIDVLVHQHGFSLPQFHVIGFSLGGQTAGYIGNFLTSGKLHRVTGLDPSLPLYYAPSTSKRHKLDPSDGKYVDVLHTNALHNGKLEVSGHIDFYANGGLSQPGCLLISNISLGACDHFRAPAYYAESINSKVGFYGTKCYSWLSYVVGRCNGPDHKPELLFGEHLPYGSKGRYFFNTNSESPYARGLTSDNTFGLKNNKTNSHEVLSTEEEEGFVAYLESNVTYS